MNSMAGRPKELIECENIAEIAMICKVIGKVYYWRTVDKTLEYLGVWHSALAAYCNDKEVNKYTLMRMEKFIKDNEWTDNIDYLYKKYFIS